MKRTFWMLVATLASLIALVPTSASADTYSVFSCRDPLGPANAALGWVGSQSGTGVVTNTCSAGGALSGLLNEPNPPGNSSASWQFDAPAGTRIVRVAARRTTAGLRKSTQASDLAYILDTNSGAVLERCAPASDSTCIADLREPLDRQGLNAAWVRFRALCTNAGGTCSSPLRVDAQQLNVGLQDIFKPVVAGARLLDNGDASGILRVGFNAVDAGGGLYRAILKVDGKPTRTMPLAGGSCTDALPSDLDPYQFDVPVPCPRTLTGASVSVDVKSLPPGPHGLEFALEDAAGNEAAVFGPVEFPKLNVITGSSIPAADLIRGQLRMWFVKARNRGTRYTSRLGTRVVTRGILRTPSGRGIEGARIDVYHIRRDGTRRLVKTGLKTRARGRLTLILPLDVDTRRIEYAYRALRPGPVTSASRLRLRVRNRAGRTYYRQRR